MEVELRFIDRTGERFGRLTVVSRAPNQGRRTAWFCRCDCGAESVALSEALTYGLTKSCGCLRREVTADRSMKHGHSVGRRMSKTLRAYFHAKARCTNKNDAKYEQYGGRGITFCERWASSAENFISDMGECPDGHSLDRIDVNGGYEPHNCRWATSYTQARNRTDNVFVDTKDGKVILKDYALHNGLNYKKLHRLYRMEGMTLHEASIRSKLA